MSDASGARQGMALLVWSATVEQSERCAIVWMSAQACAALDLQVEMYFTGPSVRLLLVEQQTQRIGYGDDAQALSHHLMQTQQAGVGLWACSQALHHLKISPASLVPGCATGGLVQFAARCADPRWGSLVF